MLLDSDNSQQFLGLDSFAMSPIVNNAEDGPFVCENETGNEFSVYSYKAAAAVIPRLLLLQAALCLAT